MDKIQSEGVSFHQFMKVLGFKPPTDTFGLLDIVKLDDELSKRDPDYDNINCTYQERIRISMRSYLEIKYGKNAVILLEALLNFN